MAVTVAILVTNATVQITNHFIAVHDFTRLRPKLCHMIKVKAIMPKILALVCQKAQSRSLFHV